MSGNKTKTRTTPGVRKREYPRKDGSVTTTYTARLAYLDGSGKRVYDESRSFPTKREASAEYIRMKAAREAGTYTAPTTMTVTDYFEGHWLKSIKARVKASTYGSYERDWNRHLKPEFGALRLQALTPLQFDGFYGTLATERTMKIATADGTIVEQVRKPLSAKTIRNIHATAVKALGDAVDAGLVAHNAASKAKPPRVIRHPEDEIKAWDEDELVAFLNLYKKDRWYPEMRLAALTGMRRGEVLGLRWKDIDLDNNTLSVRQTLLSTGYKTYFDSTKSHKARTINLDPKTVKVLKRRRAAQNEERLAGGESYMVSGLVFTNEDGSLVHPDSFSQAFERLVERTTFQRITLHGLRHTHATLMLKAGVSVKVVSERLGHSDPGFTLRQYAHVLPSMQADAVKKLSAMLDG